MELIKLLEAGESPALQGIALSFHTPDASRQLADILADLPDTNDIAKRLAFKDGGENKFLEFLITYWGVRAPLTWWKQFDTYRHAMQFVDASCVQRESTMHTIMRRPLRQSDFAQPIDDAYLARLNEMIAAKDFEAVVYGLPCGFLQVGVVKMNYQALRNILHQREHHKLKGDWGIFCREVVTQVNRPDLLPRLQILTLEGFYEPQIEGKV